MDDQGTSENSSPGHEEKADKIDVHYDQSPSYRTFHVDGVHGGVSPRGDHLVFDLYAEKRPNPKLIRHGIEEVEGERTKLGDEISRGGREGILREAQCGIAIDWGAALRLYEWLGEQIQTARDAGIIDIEEQQNNES